MLDALRTALEALKVRRGELRAEMTQGAHDASLVPLLPSQARRLARAALQHEEVSQAINRTREAIAWAEVADREEDR